MSSPGVLFLVPARGGSVRVPGKNLRLVAGIPLVARAVRVSRLAAEAVPRGPHAVVCSTDDAEIARVAEAWGAEVPFRRPAPLADAAATSVDVALHALGVLEAAGRTFRALVLVQPTSPLTDPGDLAAAVARFDAIHRPVVAVTGGHPAAFHVTGSDRDAVAVLEGGLAAAADRRLSGAFYVVEPRALRADRRFLAPGATVGLEVPPERSVDVDVESDLAIAESLARARHVQPIDIAGCRIGAGRAFLIAEGGVNHNGDPDLAHRLVDAAADGAADAVKFQTFDPAALAAAGAPMADYQRAAGERGADQREMLARLALPLEAWAGLQQHAHERGLVFLSTPFDIGSAELLDRLGVPAFKVGSGELTNIGFIERLARFGRPMLISTGMADMLEVADAVDAVRRAGDPPIALLHCVSSYPAAPEDANLRAIETLRAAFGVPSGWSDHTPGIELPIGAVALGASIVEKHLTLDRTMPGPDHAASLEPDAFAAMTAAIRAVEPALGTGDKRPVEAELRVARVARRSLHWTRDLALGEVVAEEDLVALRPATGLSPARLRDVVGRRTARAVRAGAAATAGDLEPDA